MSTPTKRDAINAAMSVADDVAQGRLDPSALEAEMVAEVTALVGQVSGPDDPLWPVQLDVARGVLAAGGIPADELSEWLAVARNRAVLLGDAGVPAEPVSSLSGASDDHSGDPDGDD